MNPDHTAWKKEEDRQAAALANALQATIQEHGNQLLKDNRQPILNAVAAALVAVEAGMLAAIRDDRHRKEMRRAMDRARPRALAQAMTRDNGAAQVVVIGGAKQ